MSTIQKIDKEFTERLLSMLSSRDINDRTLAVSLIEKVFANSTGNINVYIGYIGLLASITRFAIFGLSLSQKKINYLEYWDMCKLNTPIVAVRGIRIQWLQILVKTMEHYGIDKTDPEQYSYILKKINWYDVSFPVEF